MDGSGDIHRNPRYISQLTRSTFAMVLAGGRGSRLLGLTDLRSKPAVPFGGKFRIIDFTLSNCVNSSVRRIGVATQYKSQSLIRHLHLAWSFLDGRMGEFIEIMPAQQQVDESFWYRGTADAAYHNLREISHAKSDYVLVLSGDHIYRMDYGHMLAAHVERGADLTVACVQVLLHEASSFGVMSVYADHRIRAFAEKPIHPQPMPGHAEVALASMGIYVFNKKFLFEQLKRDADYPDSSHDFGKDVIPYCVEHHRSCAYNFADVRDGDGDKSSYWRDVGTLDAYWEANMDLLQVSPHLNLYDDNWPIWTWQPQVAPAKFVHDEETRRGVAIDSLVAGGSIIGGATIRRTMLFYGGHVHSHAVIEDSILLPKVNVGRDCQLRKCIVDRGCLIPDGTRIGFDPLEDRQCFHVTASGITLVTRMMLGQDVSLLR
jgi:glucose-1-phosphate adenylyltransferase